VLFKANGRRRIHAVAVAASFTAWQATPLISAGALPAAEGSNASGQRGLKAQPGGGSIGFGISPFYGNALAAGHCQIRHRAQQHLV